MADAERDGPPPLDYSAPHTAPSAARTAIQALVALVVTCGVGVGTALALLGTAIERDVGGDSGGGVAYAVVGLALLAALLLISILLRRDPRHRGWSIGIWIGLALPALAAGVCFSDLME